MMFGVDMARKICSNPLCASDARYAMPRKGLGVAPILLSGTASFDIHRPIPTFNNLSVQKMLHCCHVPLVNSAGRFDCRRLSPDPYSMYPALRFCEESIWLDNSLNL